MPLPAHRADHGSRVPLEQLWRYRAPHITLETSPLERQWCLREAESVSGTIAYVGFGYFLEDLGENFVREVVDVH